MEFLKCVKVRLDGLVASIVLLGFSPAAFAGREEQDPLTDRALLLDGHRVEWLINITMTFLTVLFVLMCIGMVIAIIRHSENHQAQYDHADAKMQVAVALSISAMIFLGSFGRDHLLQDEAFSPETTQNTVAGENANVADSAAAADLPA